MSQSIAIQEIMTPKEADKLKFSHYPSVMHQERKSDKYIWERSGEKTNLIFIREGRMTFAVISVYDADLINYEETERRANLFCAAPSMLKLLEKALPIIEAEANDRESTKEDDLLQGYWSEMRDLANEIEQGIKKAKGEDTGEQQE